MNEELAEAAAVDDDDADFVDDVVDVVVVDVAVTFDSSL